MLDASYYEKTDEIIACHTREERSLIPIIQDIQEEYRYLPPELLSYVAGKIGISEAKAFSVASFYENFSFEAKGKYVIKVCDGTACHVRKSIPILEGLYKELGLNKDKHTTDDQLFTVETVSCLGACGLAPAVMINDEVYGKMTPEKMSELIKAMESCFNQQIYKIILSKPKKKSAENIMNYKKITRQNLKIAYNGSRHRLCRSIFLC